MQNYISPREISSLTGLWLKRQLGSKELKRLIAFLLPHFKVCPDICKDSGDATEEKEQLIGEFLCMYRETRGEFVLFGNFTDQQLKNDLINHLKNFSYGCLTSFRRKLIGRVNAALKPCNGFKRLHGKIVGLESDVQANRPSLIAEHMLFLRWKEIASPPLHPDTGLPNIKDLARVARKMFELAEGWLFKKTFYSGIEGVFRLKEPSVSPYQNNSNNEEGLIGLEELCPNPDFVQPEFLQKIQQSLGSKKIDVAVKNFIYNHNIKWQKLLFLMLFQGAKPVEAADIIGITQQACGKNFRRMLGQLREIISEFDEFEQKAFVLKLEQGLIDAEKIKSIKVKMP
ncbi:MAG: hypothetical protein AB1403_18955 [Candidatus Riflebacteria bacterium]